VWVFDGKTRILAIGVLRSDQQGTFPLPATLDLHTFHVVDISAEPYDGDQTHSAQSVLRGSLDG
jgi:Anti-sigma-K factor rskA